MTRTFAILGILCYTMTLHSQDTDKKTEHAVSFKSQYIQIRDEFNYGLVNRGLNLVAESYHKNEQIISAEWIMEMISIKVDLEGDYKFGYYWWLDTKRNIQFTWGHGGQFAFIVPDQDLIVVMTSIPNTQGDYQIQADEALPVVDQIIEACNRDQ